VSILKDCLEGLPLYSIWESKNPIMFGTGSSLETGRKLGGFGCKKILCIYGKNIKSSGLADPILKSISDAGIEIVPYHEVIPDPPD
jgi:alcohol dehydrogenase class IV